MNAFWHSFSWSWPLWICHPVWLGYGKESLGCLYVCLWSAFSDWLGFGWIFDGDCLAEKDGPRERSSTSTHTPSRATSISTNSSLPPPPRRPSLLSPSTYPCPAQFPLSPTHTSGCRGQGDGFNHFHSRFTNQESWNALSDRLLSPLFSRWIPHFLSFYSSICYSPDVPYIWAPPWLKCRKRTLLWIKGRLRMGAERNILNVIQMFLTPKQIMPPSFFFVVLFFFFTCACPNSTGECVNLYACESVSLFSCCRCVDVCVLKGQLGKCLYVTRRWTGGLPVMRKS